MPAGPPEPDTMVPPAVGRLAAGRPVSVVWANPLGGLTFRVGAGQDGWFVKWAPAASGLDLAAEADRMRWVRPFSPVPKVVDTGEDAHGSWLVTTPLQGDSAVADRWTRQPGDAVRAIGAGLRHLHDHAPVERCPFSWSLADRVTLALRRAREGITEPRAWHAEHRALGLAGARSILAEPPTVDRAVVCHGDACAPNTIVGGDGCWSGHVDLGTLGVADRWADLAVATWSTAWNYGPGWERALLDAYGIDPDPPRIAYYRLLWDLT